MIGRPNIPRAEGEPFTFGVIADPHLDLRLPDREERFRTALSACADAGCDFVVVAGDVFEHFDEAAVPTLRRACADEFPGGVWLVPGNHDVGNKPGLEGAVSDEKRARWLAAFGCDRWAFDHGGFRFVGIDDTLCNSGLPCEAEQEEWLRRTLSGRRCAIFAHYPLFLKAPDEPAGGYWTVDPPARGRIMELLSRSDVRAVFTGHLHRERRVVLSGRIHATTPATSFSCDPDPTLLGYRIVHASADGLEDVMHRLPPGVYNPPPR